MENSPHNSNLKSENVNQEENLFNDIKSKIRSTPVKGDTIIDFENTVNLIKVEKGENPVNTPDDTYGKRKRADDSDDSLMVSTLQGTVEKLPKIKWNDRTFIHHAAPTINNSMEITAKNGIEEISSPSYYIDIDSANFSKSNHCTKKKRKKGTDTYAQKSRQIKRNSGEKYCTGNGKIVNEKKFENEDCRCLKKCIDLISAEERKQMFDTFWNLADFKKQNILLYGATQRCVVQRKRFRNRKGNPRSHSFKYYLTTTSKTFLVCRKFFLDTYKISVGRLHRAVSASVPGLDLRGKMAGSSRKTNDEDLASVREHILSFPTFPGHCSRAHNPGMKYLNPELNIKKMYDLYVEKCKENDSSHVNDWIYRKIFNKEFKLDFHHPCKDQCEKCDTVNMKIKASSNIEENINKIKKYMAVHKTCVS